MSMDFKPSNEGGTPPFAAVEPSGNGGNLTERPSNDCEPYRNQREMQQELLRVSNSLQRELSTAWSVANKVTQTMHRKHGDENANTDGYYYAQGAVQDDEPSDSDEEENSQQGGSQPWRINDKLERNLYSLKRTQAVAADAIESMFRAINDSMRPDNATGSSKRRQRDLMYELSSVVDVADQNLPRPKCALFVHSLERNGANNFVLFVTKKLLDTQEFELFSPKDGPMKTEFERMGVPVNVVPPEEESYHEVIKEKLKSGHFGVVLVNTIMRAEVINIVHEMSLPNVWVIHEAWPADQFEYYAKEVFLMKHIDSAVITRAFSSADHIVFPAHVQRKLYASLIPQSCDCSVVYNGIPLKKIDNFRTKNDREEVRANLGYTEKDFVVLHLGTVCKRKAQLCTAQAFRKLVNEHGDTSARLLIVGARYIRDHEIKYLNEIKDEISAGGLEDKVTILDIQKNVLPYYMAADVVVVPSLNEVLPLVVCEAMAFERPVVASDIDGIPEALTDGQDGFLIPPGDPNYLAERVHQLINTPKLRRQFCRRGRQRVMRQFSYDTMGNAYRRIMDDVIDSATEKRMRSKSLRMPTLPNSKNVRGGGLESEDDDNSDYMSEEEDNEDEGSDNIEHKQQQKESAELLVSKGTQTSDAGLLGSMTVQYHGRTESPIEPQPSSQQSSDEKKVVLVDMDSTVVNFDGAFLQRWMRRHPESAKEDAKLVNHRQHYELEMNFPLEKRGEVLATISAPGLYVSMEAHEAAIQKLKWMVAKGYDVRLVTAPHPLCAATCAAEKYQWVADNLGAEWQPRLILAQDKTHVKGDILIDDKPRVVGSATPVWKHVIFSQPWNYNQPSVTVDGTYTNAEETEEGIRMRIRNWGELEALLEKVCPQESLYSA
eukprot:gb/GECG01009737.1/.p1 GENE.gb/GECG01009737.1/~~gb/GECG01009737.1/.p1  ORF type:complete len:886 (+),score=137.66 gb/GECG01009737.1/:1-2658(+)